MTDPVPSKECDCCKDGYFPFCPCGCHQRAAAQRVAHAVSMEEQCEHLRRENVRWENAHKILLSEIERLKRPAHEREPPHCQSCSCGMVDPLQAETRAATSRGAHSTEDAGRPGPSAEPCPVPDLEFERLVGDFGTAISQWTTGSGSREEAKAKAEAVLARYYQRNAQPPGDGQ